ncbi:MAG: hypothetical protein LC105_08465 [Chitinophagales bacterium]|nr:hypothetical protein [Chitinophagales bacterium]MCZ2393873.1 hypothetical protein [Chitinophagales bacterium]
MKRASLIIVCFSFLIILLYFISIFLPSTYQISQSELIYGNPKTTFQLVNNLKNWEFWNVWIDSSSKHLPSYSPKYIGKGAFFKWKSGKGDYNSIEIIRSIPNSEIDISIRTPSAEPILAQIRIEELKEGTSLHWDMTLHFKDSGSRVMGFFIYRWFIRDIKKSLKKINPYLFESHQHSGWVSNGYYIENSIGNPSIFTTDTINSEDYYQHTDSVARQFKSIQSQKFQTQDFYFFIKTITTLTNGKMVVLYGSPVLKNHPYLDSIPVDYFEGKYMVFKYYGSEEGYEKAIIKAKEEARKNGWSIDLRPYVSFYDYFNLKNELDTNSMRIGFLIQ